MASGEAAARPRRRFTTSVVAHVLGSKTVRATALLFPPLAWVLVFGVVPVVFLALYSVDVLSLFPGSAGFTWQAWHTFLGQSIYLHLFWKSLRMSLVVSASSVVLAYPIAYGLAFVMRRRRYVLLVLVIAPFMTSFLLRVFAWKVILGDEGVVNSFLYWTGIRAAGHPAPGLIYSQFAVAWTLIYAWTPFVVLPIFVSLETLDRRLLAAAADLGASRTMSFLRVTFPLSLPGVVAGFIFVFIPTLGEFVTPRLVGGSTGYLYGNAINDLFTQSIDWQIGSALAVFLVLIAVCLSAVFARLLTATTLTPRG